MPARRDDLLVVLAAAVPLALYLAREHAIAGAPGFPLDDSWIHLQFARNIAEGAGFSYNAGHPVAGSTAPLWTVLLAAVALIAGPSIVAARVLGVGLTIVAALVLRRTALAWGAPAPVALCAAVVFLWCGPIAWGSLSGMEVSLAALLVAGALLAHADGRLVATAGLAALSVLARPEAILLVVLLAVAAPLSARRIAVFVVVTALVLAPSVAFSLHTVGAPIPATAAAKVQGGLIGWLGGVREDPFRTWIARPRDYVVAWIAWLWSTHAALPLALPAIVAAWRKRGMTLGVPALALIAQPLAMALLAPYREPSFQEGRYSMHLLPVALLVLAVAIADHPPRARRAVLLASLALAIVTLPAGATRYAWGVQNINAMQVEIGRWLGAHTPRHARLAVNDIGAIAYLSRREVIDLMGLVTPDIIPYRRRGETGVIEYVRERCPDFVVVFPSWFPLLTAREDLLEPVHRVRLEHNLVSGGDEMVVYRVRSCAV